MGPLHNHLEVDYMGPLKEYGPLCTHLEVDYMGPLKEYGPLCTHLEVDYMGPLRESRPPDYHHPEADRTIMCYKGNMHSGSFKGHSPSTLGWL